MTLEEAQQAIEDAGLHSQVENVADDEVEEGRVISTNPSPAQWWIPAALSPCG